MRYSTYLIPTLKENPQDAEVLSHRLMIRSGLVRKLASGTYSYLPMGLKALRKAEGIVREEMNRAGALEVLLPAIHPAELWKESGRFDILGEDMIHFKDRHGKMNVLGPTHEEIITDLVRHEVQSYKQLPVNLYQIQTKFRDEMRPRSGVIRSREFLMKDAYSFHVDTDCLDKTYDAMKEAYTRIYKRCGLDVFIVEADPGAMGGSGSQEFVLFSDAGEDLMARLGKSDKVVSAEMAERVLQMISPSAKEKGKYQEVHTPEVSSIEAVSSFLKVKPDKLVKTLIYSVGDDAADASQMIAVLVRGDHEVSDYKVKKKFPKAALASREAIEGLGSSFGFSGPLGLKSIPLLVDEDVIAMDDFVIGANKKDYHLMHVYMGDLLSEAKDRLRIGDYRIAQDGDEAEVDGKRVRIKIKTAIELGHIFKLNLRYSEPMKAVVLNEKGKESPVFMGCYGIGVNRIIAAAIEQGGNDKGTIWPSLEISPFEVTIISTNIQDEQVLKESQKIYDLCITKGWDPLWDDRDLSAGVKFNDADLIGIPIRIVIGPRGLKNNSCEIKDLINNTSEDTPLDKIEETISNLRNNLLSKTAV